ncbi:MAG: PIN domain-containing protein [Candidatus Gracilibacteria bacterium]
MLIDSNIIIEIAKGQENAKDCSDFLEALKRGVLHEDVYISRFSLHAVEAIIWNFDKELLKEILLLIHLGLLIVVDTKIKDDLMAFSLAGDLKLDFDDTVQFICAGKHATALITYDKDFSKTGLQTKTPREALEEILA